MSTAAALTTAPQELLLKIISGRDKGAAYRLVGAQIRIGRAIENDVVLDDVKASRQHAFIARRGTDYVITDLQSSVGTWVNGEKITERALSLHDEVKIGETILTLDVVDRPLGPLTLVPPQAPMPSAPGAPAGLSAPILNSPHKSKIGSTNRQSNSPFLIFGVLVVALTILAMKFTHSQAAQKKALHITDDSGIASELADSEKEYQKLEHDIAIKGKDSQQYAEAQAFYLRGFREFDAGNFGRAIQNFEASLALYPEYPLAKRYLQRARLKNDQLITQALQRAEQEFQLQKYMSACNGYKTVLLLTRGTNNRNYDLARKRVDAIDLILSNKQCTFEIQRWLY